MPRSVPTEGFQAKDDSKRSRKVRKLQEDRSAHEKVQKLKHKVIPDVPQVTARNEVQLGRAAGAQQARHEAKQQWRATMRDPLVKSVIKDRVNQFSLSTIRTAPMFVATKAFDPAVSPQQLQKLARNTEASINWLSQRDTFGGEGGAMTAARLYAIQTGNQAALTFLERMQVMLTPAEQEIALNLLRNPEKLAEVTNTPDQSLPYGVSYDTQGQRAYDIMEKLFPGIDVGPTVEKQMEEGDAAEQEVFQLAPEDRSVDTVLALRSLFPETAQYFKIGDGLAAIDRWAAQDTAGRVTDFVGAYTRPARAFLGEISKPFMAGQRAFVWSATMGNPQAAGFINHNFDAAFAHVQHIAAESVGEATAGAMVKMGILEPDSESYDNLKQFMGDLTIFFLMKKAGELGQGYTAPVKYLPDYAKNRLGIERGFAETNFGGGITGRFGGDALLNSGILHFFKGLEYGAKSIGYRLGQWRFGADVASVLEYRNVMGIQPLQNFFDRVEEMKNRYPGDKNQQMGSLAQVHGERLPAPLASRLLDVPRNEMETTFIDYWKNRRSNEVIAAEEDLSKARTERQNALDFFGDEEAQRVNNDAFDDVAAERTRLDGERYATQQRGGEQVPPRTYRADTFDTAAIREDLGLGDEFGTPDGYTYHVGRPEMLPRTGEMGLEPNFRNPREVGGAEEVPWYEREWEDGAVEQRLYHHDDPAAALDLAGDPEPRMIFRWRKSELPASEKGLFADEKYTEQTVPPEAIGYFGQDMQWHPVSMASVDVRIAALDAQLADIAGARQQRAAVLRDVQTRERIAERVKRDEANATEPVIQYPKTSVMRAATFNPITRAERIAGAIFGGLKKGTAGFLDPAKLVDSLPTRPVIFNSERSDYDSFKRNESVHNLTYYLRKAGVKNEEAARLIGEYLELEHGTAKTGQAFYTWWKDRASPAIDAALPKNTPAELRRSLTTISEVPTEARAHYWIRRNGNREPVVGDRMLGTYEDIVSRPASPSQFMGNITLPDIDFLTEATSAWRRTRSYFKRRDPFRVSLPKQIRDVIGSDSIGPTDLLHLPTALLRFGTTLLKGPILGLRAIAMTERIQLEQVMRKRALGYRGVVTLPGGVRVPAGAVDGAVGWLGGTTYGQGFELLPSDPRFAKFRGPEEMELGQLHENLAGLEYRTSVNPVRTSDIEAGYRQPTRGEFDSWGRAINEMHNDWFIREMVRRDLDRDQIWDFINNDEKAHAYVFDEQLPILMDERSIIKGDTPEARINDWLDRTGEAIMLHTGGHPSFLNAIRTGKIREGGTLMVDSHGNPLGEVYSELQARREQLRGTLKTLREEMRPSEENLATFRARSEELRDVVEQLEDLETRNGGAIEGGSHTGMDDIRGTGEALERAWRNGEVAFPPDLQLQQRTSWTDVHGPRAAIRNTRIMYTHITYGPLRIASWADMKGTRGSLYYQQAEQFYKTFRYRGYSEASARAFAEQYAANSVRDIMYDLGAHTSFQRAVKDVFWFAPAHQEMLYTWLVRIPGEQGGAFGAVTLPFRAKAAIEMLKDSGVIQQNNQGDDVIEIPSVLGLVTKLPGINDLLGNPKVPNTEYWKADAFNLVLQNNLVPTISTLPAKSLGAVAAKYGGGWKAISDIITFNGANTTLIPMQLQYLSEAVTGGPIWDPLSPDYVKGQSDRVWDVALQVAAAELAQRGVLPPRPDQFGTADENGLVTNIDESRYNKARRAYRAQLFSLGEDYHSGMAWTRFLGSAMSPAQIKTDSSDRVAYQRFVEEHIYNDGDSLTEEDRDELASYISRHPGSLFYGVSITKLTGQSVDLPYSTTDNTEERYWEEFLRGEREYRTRTEMATMLMGMASWRFYQDRRRAQLESIAPDGKAATLLTQGYKKQVSLAQLQWDYGNYTRMNPEFNQMMAENRRLWHDKYGFPIQTVETERIADTLTTLNVLSSAFTGESGIRSDEFKATVGELKQIWANEMEWGEPTTQYAKDMKWYMEEVYIPYLDEGGPIALQAIEAKEGGNTARAAELWGQFSQMQDRYNDETLLTHNGEVFPTPEAVTFGNKKPVEQRTAIRNWTSKPPSWLTTFQVEQVGYPDFEGRDELLRNMAAATSWYYDELDRRNIESNSEAGDKLEQELYKDGLRYAKSFGPEGEALYKLENATPAERLVSTGFHKNDEAWQATVAEASRLTDVFKRMDYSAAGWATTGRNSVLDRKIQFYIRLEQMRDENQQFDDALESLSYAMPESGLDQRSSISLYEALFFNNFSPYPPPNEVYERVYRGS